MTNRPQTRGSKLLREDINISRAVKEQLNRIVQQEHERDQQNDCRPRSRSAILEMLLRKGIRVWEREHRPITGRDDALLAAAYTQDRTQPGQNE